MTGTARYTGDLGPLQIGADLLHAAVVQSTCGSGRITEIDTGQAEAAAGVRAVLTFANAPRLKPVKTLTGSELDRFLPLQDECLHYNGQPIGLVIADTLIEARCAASLVAAVYEPDAKPDFSFDAGIPFGTEVDKVAAREKGKVSRGKPEPAFSGAPLQLDLTYRTASAHHNAVEPGACIAFWDKWGRLTVWNASQFVYGDAMTLGEAFGFGPLDRKFRLAPQLSGAFSTRAKIRVLAPLVGGAFGSKGGPSAHVLLAAMAAQVTGRPVKLVLTREQTYSMMPYRSAIVQRVKIGANSDGRLLSVSHDATIQNSHVGSFNEPVAELTPHLYACEHVRTNHKVVRLQTNAPGWMRAPGAAPGLYGIECAMDELAEKLALDPVELRLRNYADVDPANGKPWSSKSLKECYRVAGERIGWWNDRDPACGSMRDGELLIGYGMATAMYRTNHFPAVAKVSLNAQGSARVESAVHEIGQGAITAMTQVAAEALGLPLDRVHFDFGDSDLPFSFITAGSATMLSVGAAIKEAADKIRRDLILRAITDKASPLHGFSPREIELADGRLYLKNQPMRGEAHTGLLARHPQRTFTAKAITGRTFGRSPYGRAAFGAQFAKVAVDEETGQIKVRRLVGAFGCGRIINETTARSQILGGMVWGIGHALLEETVMDSRDGSWVNSNLAEALVPTNSDVPQLEAHFVEEDDSRGSALGAKGLGEIGITGVAAAIASAVYHATGKRIYQLPIRLNNLLRLDYAE